MRKKVLFCIILSLSYGFTPQNGSFLAKFSPFQKLKVAIYKDFVILGRQK